MKRIKAALPVVAASLMVTVSWAQELWTAKDGSVRSADARALVISGDAMYLATRSEVYRSTGDNKKWESVFTLPTGENEIRCAAGSGERLLIGTRRGLFLTEDSGFTWKNVFRTIAPEKSDVAAIDICSYSPERLAIGSRRGVYLSEDNGRRWRDAGGLLRNKRIDKIVYGRGIIFVCSEDGVFVRKDGSDDWDRIYVSKRPEGSPEGGQELSTGQDGETRDRAVSIAISGVRIYIAGVRGIIYSDDGGHTWTDLPNTGISGSLTCILPAKGSGAIYCGTTKGVFRYYDDKKAWNELYKGTQRQLNIRSLIFDGESEESLWAVTDSGLYKYEGARLVSEEIVDVEKPVKAVAIIYDGEPSYEELQRAAIGFNEVDPEKISRWRSQARLKALVPKVSVGMDNNRSNTYEIYTSATKDYIVSGPDDMSEGFDLSISWELGDMIWSDDQTNIDVRSKLTTELRNDILAELRRSYYERKRLQYELVVSPPKDMRLRFEKELRVRELGQVIDDLTGNYLAKRSMKRTADNRQ